MPFYHLKRLCHKQRMSGERRDPETADVEEEEEEGGEEASDRRRVRNEDRHKRERERAIMMLGFGTETLTMTPLASSTYTTVAFLKMPFGQKKHAIFL